MLLSLKQRYVVDVLDKLGCIRRDQLYILTRDAFKTEEYTLTENQMGGGHQESAVHGQQHPAGKRLCAVRNGKT